MGEGGQDHKVKEEKRDNCLFAKLLLTGKLINEKLLLKPTFQYSTIPWPRPGMQGQHSMGTTSETLQRQKSFPRNSRQGRPLFQVQGKDSSPNKCLYFQ